MKDAVPKRMPNTIAAGVACGVSLLCVTGTGIGGLAEGDGVTEPDGLGEGEGESEGDGVTEGEGDGVTEGEGATVSNRTNSI
jgi:hypothetical protein